MCTLLQSHLRTTISINYIVCMWCDIIGCNIIDLVSQITIKQQSQNSGQIVFV
jgi:hypothetical protein